MTCMVMQIASKVYGLHGDYMRIDPKLKTPVNTFTYDKKLIKRVIYEVENDKKVNQLVDQMAQSMINQYLNRMQILKFEQFLFKTIYVGSCS